MDYRKLLFKRYVNLTCVDKKIIF